MKTINLFRGQTTPAGVYVPSLNLSPDRPVFYIRVPDPEISGVVVHNGFATIKSYRRPEVGGPIDWLVKTLAQYDAHNIRRDRIFQDFDTTVGFEEVPYSARARSGVKLELKKVEVFP